MKYIKVTNCKGCPFSMAEVYNTHISCDCLHPLQQSKPIDSYYREYKMPKWCPLKENPITIAT